MSWLRRACGVEAHVYVYRHFIYIYIYIYMLGGLGMGLGVARVCLCLCYVPVSCCLLACVYVLCYMFIVCGGLC